MAVMTYLEAIRRGLQEEMEADDRVFLIGEDIGVYGGAFKVTAGFRDRFGEDRVIDTPISEAGIVGAAMGAALNGMRPVAEMQFIDFIACAFEQITNMIASARWRWGASIPMVVRGPCGGGVGGGPFHSQNMEAYFFHTPGLKIVEPATARDARSLIRAAIRDDDPVLFFEHKFLYRRIREDVPEEDDRVPIGKAAVRRSGGDVTVVTYGSMVHVAIESAAALQGDGVDVEVVDLRTLLPLDEETILASAAKTGKIVVLHEDRRTGGIGGEIAAIIAEKAFDHLDGPIVRVASLDAPVPYSQPLEEAYMPNAARLTSAIRELVAY